MSINEQSELVQFQGNGYEKSKCETKFILAEEKKKREEEKLNTDYHNIADVSYGYGDTTGRVWVYAKKKSTS